MLPSLPLPSRRLLVLLAATAPLHLVGAGYALGAAAVLLALAAFDLRRIAGPNVPTVEREVPIRMSRGASGRVRLAVRNRGEELTRVRIVDDLPEGLERTEGYPPYAWYAGRPPLLDARLEPDDSASTSYEIRATGRGDVLMGRIHMRCLGPLGLAWREIRLSPGERVRIQPGALDLRRNRLLGIRHRLRLMGLRNVRQRGQGRSFESLRDYVRGDDPRAIEWKASARRGDILVRQYEAERSQNVVLAVDAGRLMLESLGDRERLDHALSSALLLADVAIAHGDRVGLLVFADTVQQFLPPRRQTLAGIADALASVRGRMAESNYPLAFSHLSRSVRRRSLVALFTDVIDQSASAALLAEIARSSERHLVLAVALRNPELAARADRPAETELDAYRRAAAEEMLRARETALARLRRRGTLISDSEPDQVVTDVLNRYLDVKYRGLL